MQQNLGGRIQNQQVRLRQNLFGGRDHIAVHRNVLINQGIGLAQKPTRRVVVGQAKRRARQTLILGDGVEIRQNGGLGHVYAQKSDVHLGLGHSGRGP